MIVCKNKTVSKCHCIIIEIRVNFLPDYLISSSITMIRLRMYIHTYVNIPTSYWYFCNSFLKHQKDFKILYALHFLIIFRVEIATVAPSLVYRKFTMIYFHEVILKCFIVKSSTTVQQPIQNWAHLFHLM